MSIFNKETDFTKSDKITNLPEETVEVTIDHCKGETWRISISKSKLNLFDNSLAACFSGTSNYVMITDIMDDTVIFGRELLLNSCIAISK